MTRCGSSRMGAAVKPDHHRQRHFRRPDGGHHIQKQTVFFAGFRVTSVPISQNRLRAWSAKRGRVSHSIPPLCGERLMPAQFAHRRLSVWNCKKLCAAPLPSGPLELTSDRTYEEVVTCRVQLARE